jgi:hypothetical protein
MDVSYTTGETYSGGASYGKRVTYTMSAKLGIDSQNEIVYYVDTRAEMDARSD